MTALAVGCTCGQCDSACASALCRPCCGACCARKEKMMHVYTTNNPRIEARVYVAGWAAEEAMAGIPEDSLERARHRYRVATEGLYDREEGEPDQDIRDLLTDVMHEAAARGVDFEEALRRASTMWTQEREDWEIAR